MGGTVVSTARFEYRRRRRSAVPGARQRRDFVGSGRTRNSLRSTAIGRGEIQECDRRSAPTQFGISKRHALRDRVQCVIRPRPPTRRTGRISPGVRVAVKPVPLAIQPKRRTVKQRSPFKISPVELCCVSAPLTHPSTDEVDGTGHTLGMQSRVGDCDHATARLSANHDPSWITSPRLTIAVLGTWSSAIARSSAGREELKFADVSGPVRECTFIVGAVGRPPATTLRENNQPAAIREALGQCCGAHVALKIRGSHPCPSIHGGRR